MSHKRIKTFEDLDCWKACRELRQFVVKEVLPVLPKDERYRLGDQMLRAARSTTANIAEGYGRYHFMDIARHILGDLSSALRLIAMRDLPRI